MIDPEQIAYLKERMKEAVKGQPALNYLYGRLLEVGGKAVAARYEEDAEKILERGLEMSPKSLRMMIGDRNACHANTARLYETNQNQVKIVTGYALSSDQVWRQHTWGLWGKKVVETTEKRTKYFGFVLTPEETEEFCRHN
jgi:hypothetical protein